jgi:hypothetical protein
MHDRSDSLPITVTSIYLEFSTSSYPSDLRANNIQTTVKGLFE